MGLRGRGFTIIEMVLVIIVIGILAMVIIPKYIDFKQQSEETSEEYIIASIKRAIATYEASKSLKQ